MVLNKIPTFDEVKNWANSQFNYYDDNDAVDAAPVQNVNGMTGSVGVNEFNYVQSNTPSNPSLGEIWAKTSSNRKVHRVPADDYAGLSKVAMDKDVIASHFGDRGFVVYSADDGSKMWGQSPVSYSGGLAVGPDFVFRTQSDRYNTLSQAYDKFTGELISQNSRADGYDHFSPHIYNGNCYYGELQGEDSIHVWEYDASTESHNLLSSSVSTNSNGVRAISSSGHKDKLFLTDYDNTHVYDITSNSFVVSLNVGTRGRVAANDDYIVPANYGRIYDLDTVSEVDNMNISTKMENVYITPDNIVYGSNLDNQMFFGYDIDAGSFLFNSTSTDGVKSIFGKYDGMVVVGDDYDGAKRMDAQTGEKLPAFGNTNGIHGLEQAELNSEDCHMMVWGENQTTSSTQYWINIAKFGESIKTIKTYTSDGWR